jgi:hypothetical protein
MLSENRGKAGRESLSPRDPLFFFSVCSGQEVLNHGGHGDHGDRKGDIRWKGLVQNKANSPRDQGSGVSRASPAPDPRPSVQNKANSQSRERSPTRGDRQERAAEGRNGRPFVRNKANSRRSRDGTGPEGRGSRGYFPRPSPGWPPAFRGVVVRNKANFQGGAISTNCCPQRRL